MPQRVGFELDIEANKGTLDRLGKIEISLLNINRYLADAKKRGDTGVYKALKQQQKDLRAEARALNKDLKEQNANLADLVDNFRIGFVRVGELRGGIRNAQKSMGIFTKAIKAQILVTKAWKIALAGTGIGLLVVGLASLVAWLTQTQQGIDFVNRSLAALKGGLTVIVSTLADFFENGFSAFNNFGERIKEGTVGVYNNTAATQALRDEWQQLDLEMAEVLNKEKQLSKIAEDTSKSAKERAAAAAEGIKLEQDLRAKLIDFKEREIAAEQKLLDAKGETALTEDRQRLIDLRKELEELETASFERETTLNSKLNVSNQALKKTLEDVKKATEGSLTAITEKLGMLNKEVEGGALTGNALKDKLKEILDLEAEFARLNNTIEELKNKLKRDAEGPPDAPQPLDEPGGFGVTLGPITPEDGEIERLDNIRLRKKEISDQEKEDFLKAQKEKKDALEEAAQYERDLVEQTYTQLSDITAAFYSGQIENIGDFAAASLTAVLDSVEKQIDVQLIALRTKLLTELGLVGGTAAYFGIRTLIKGLLSRAKSTVSQLEEGGVTNPGFVAKGARHYHGGINLGNGQEIEGGEPVLTRRAATLFPDAINYINQAAGGRRILQDGGILSGASGGSTPTLPSQFFNNSQGVDPEMLAKYVGDAVFKAAAAGIGNANRRLEREAELQQRTTL